MERLRIVLEFSKNKKEELGIYGDLIRYSSPSAHVKDILRGICPLPTLKTVDDKITQMERLRIVLEFSKNKKEELELYGNLIRHSSPATHVKDILKGLCPLPTLNTIDNINVREKWA